MSKKKSSQKTGSKEINQELVNSDFSLETQVQENTHEKNKTAKKAPVKKKANTKGKANQANEVISYRHDDKRKNNPPVGMVDVAGDHDEEKTTWAYDPHIDPALQFDISRAEIETLIDDALASGDQDTMRAALEQLKRMQAPYLNWAGKAEGTSFEVDTVSVHVHERIDPATILAGLQKRIKDNKDNNTPKYQNDLFHAPFENLPLREAVDFYKHDRDWSNRLIAGDSLLVMNSLLQKEGMAGQVQMVYIDPPYGIKYGSNFQPFTNKRDVKDRSDADLTQEPEMIKAFRDTWELGIHSYLTYLRDRLLLAKQLLSETGSCFVQISDENLHYVKNIMEEVFGPDNFVVTICFKKKAYQESNHLAPVNDYLVWYAKSKKVLKYNQLYIESIFDGDIGKYSKLQSPEGNRISSTKLSESEIKQYLMKGWKLVRVDYPIISQDAPKEPQPFSYQGQVYEPPKGRHWSQSYPDGMERVAKAGRVRGTGTGLYAVDYWNNNPMVPLTNFWEKMKGAANLIYVVQTTELAVERCLQMATDPGDLVLDPTCGSGTTAFVSEKWGRRWITCDTSRVAVTLAKQRLMTSNFDYFELKYPGEGLKGGFLNKTLPKVTMKSIADNPEIDSIYSSKYPDIERNLLDLNKCLKGKSIKIKVEEGGRKGKVVNFSAKNNEMHQFATGEQVAVNTLMEWEVPFELPSDWPEEARKPFEAFHEARITMQEKMDASIAAHADQEILYDQPQVSRNKLRITGPFTVEAVPFATVLGLDEADQPKEADVAVARSGASSRHNQWRDELLKAGIRGKGGQQIQLLDLSTVPGTKYLHAQGTTKGEGETIAVSFGPEHAALEQRQVEIAINEARNLVPKPSIIVFCAFTFDPEAAKDIDETNWPGVTLLKAQMNTDLLTEDLKKGRASNESFWLMGQPDIEVRKNNDGLYEVEVHGFDYFDTKSGELKSGGKKNIAMWSLDTNYDNRSLFPQQVFFPMAGAKDGWNKLKKDIKAELDEALMAQYHSTVSLPFEKGDNECIAVKIVDDRGIESLKVIKLD